MLRLVKTIVGCVVVCVLYVTRNFYFLQNSLWSLLCHIQFRINQLFHCIFPAYCLSDDEGINQQNDLSAIASDDEIKPENIIKTKYSSITTELISTTGGEDKTQENEFDDSGMVDECSLMQYSGKFGQQEGLSNFLVILQIGFSKH